MNDRFSHVDELRALLDAVCEESVTAEQMQRLEELVLAHPEAEACYVQYMSLHADLASHFGSLPARAEQSLRARVARPESSKGVAGVGVATTPFEDSGRATRRRLLWGAAALTAVAAAVFLAVALGPRESPAPRPPADPGEATDNTVAVLLQAPGAEWEDSGVRTRVGAPLAPGVLRLKKGLAHLEFYSGATVLLQGPAEFKLVSRLEGYLAHGRLRAVVPAQAQGFTIGSPNLDLVDRGTEFGLQVAAGDKTEIHVFQGKVELYNAGADRAPPARKELTTGQGVRLDGAEVVSIQLNPDAFLNAKELVARSQEDTERRQRAWRAARDKLRQDPTLLVYYTFENEGAWSRTLRDEAGGRKQPHDGAIVGCLWGPGRWKGKEGLEFKRVSDRVRFNVAGDFASITLAAWVRVDGLPNLNNSLMMTDGWEPGELHWQIQDSSTLILGVQNQPKKRAAHYHAPGILTPDKYGQWMHLAVVYDKDQGRVTHYVDGRPASQQATVFDVPLRIGDAELGNWNVATRSDNHPVRYLSGCMDEFMLFSRALGDAEVERLATGQAP